MTMEMVNNLRFMSFAPPKLMSIQASVLLNKLGATVNAENLLPYSVAAYMTKIIFFRYFFRIQRRPYSYVRK